MLKNSKQKVKITQFELRGPCSPMVVALILLCPGCETLARRPHLLGLDLSICEMRTISVCPSPAIVVRINELTQIVHK